MKVQYLLKNILITLIPAIFAGSPTAYAFAPETYADESRLAGGGLVKISVPSDGLYHITAAQLKAWGFNDVSRVRVYGYGGHRLPDKLIEANYTDDLPEIQTLSYDGGLVFYGHGAAEWITQSNQTYTLRQNDFSNYGYYFVGQTDAATPARAITGIATAGVAANAEVCTSFTERSHYEQERVPSPGEAGPLLLGEDFMYTRRRTISIKTPDAVTDGNASLYASFVTNCPQTGSTLSYSIGGESLSANSSDKISATTVSHYIHGTETQSAHTFKSSLLAKGIAEVTVSLNVSGDISGAWLNYISINYPRHLRIPSEGYLVFNTAKTALALDGATAGMTIFDVTDPTDIKKVSYELAAGQARWTAGNGGIRRYAAWRQGAALPSPTLIGTVAPQNLHSHRDYDMVIVTPPAFAEQAERLADLHRSDDGLSVAVVTPEQIYNEYSSGTPDPGAIRRYFKMLYDRGMADGGTPLRYAILMARTTIDNRSLTSAAPAWPIIPSWMPWEQKASLSDNDGYCSDDITAMLDDGSGASLGTDKLSIAIGRIPVTGTDEARNVVDKAIQYARSSKKTAWKHRYMFLADDQDNGIHMKQAEQMISQFEDSDGSQHLVRKVYLDAYPFNGSSYPEARNTMYRYLDEGVVWWTFVGHANTTGWTGDGIMTYTDLNNLYLRHWPFIYAATCDFLRLDGTAITGGEILYKERYGGAIGMISAVRPVYISDNGMLSNAMGRALIERDEQGRLNTPGEIYRRAKNDIRDSKGQPTRDTNRLRYIFIGDPALRLAMPSNVVTLNTINGTAVNADNQPTLAALSQSTITGSVTTPDGTVLENFNGVVMVEIFDAERSRITLGTREGSTETPFQEYGERIFCGSSKVVNGHFSLTVAMPGEVSQNFTPAAMSLYAYSTEDDTEAAGLNRSFYVYGYDESVAPDTESPVIESLVLNHSSFRSGDSVDPNPMLIATMSDNIGINLSNAGIGHQLMALLDGKESHNDLSLYYTPAADGSPAGVVNYPFENLSEGNHTLTLRVWDTAGNSSTKDIDFFVKENLAPKIFDVYTDANPASTQANFYLTHDRPDVMATVTITVYNLVGQQVWSGSATGVSDMFLSVPVTWNLTDGSGRRVGRGIYLYRATITTDGETYETASRKIAVTAQ